MGHRRRPAAGPRSGRQGLRLQGRDPGPHGPPRPGDPPDRRRQPEGGRVAAEGAGEHRLRRRVRREVLICA
ncbi:hypothetical protein G6F66_015241 [Rhizopus arrhizus]|nr:hypothetical protein G6F66_015241 [Rhizopus arrhizus]